MKYALTIAQGRALIRQVREKVFDVTVELEDFARTVKSDVREAVWPTAELAEVKADIEKAAQELRGVLNYFTMIDKVETPLFETKPTEKIDLTEEELLLFAAMRRSRKPRTG